MNYIRKRIKSLRTELKHRGVDAIVIPGSDPHFSEYPAQRWKYRKWISGFNGSAGTVTATCDSAALWVDSRYFIQAEQQLEDSGIEMRKKPADRLFDELWLKTRLGNDGKVGIDARLFSVTLFEKLKHTLAPLTPVDIGDVFDSIYPDRPALPESKAFLLPVEVTGKSRKEKLADFVKSVIPNGETYILAALDEIAWILNMRGSDIAYSPVATAWLIIDSEEAHLFMNAGQLSENDRSSLSDDGVTIHPYDSFDPFVASMADNRAVKLNFDKINCHTYQLLNSRATVVEEKSATESVAFKKAVKNEVEIEGFRRCMITDGIAMVRFLKWMNDNVGKIRITETEAARRQEEFRRQGKDYRGLSFGAVSAYGASGALPHYSPSKNTETEIGDGAFYLIDSGAHYLTGTTDITRTLHFGNPASEEKENYTLTLKGMINLSMAVFPAGTRGSQLDILARKFLWENGKNFLHGTGHGVGHYLNVHEGPQSIRSEENPVALHPGMVTSIEPAIYIEGKYGIRIENLVVCKLHRITGFGSFYSFETLTLCPIETKSIDAAMMTAEEIKWLNDYHRRVYDLLSPHLDINETEYLKSITVAI
ncbi:MAG: aminopeptidase P family protein [Prevotellaceae bacterium]|jgi:Xaa-Pro aminopeptidase|nr:aminopeptidase P family protein [Prevotellaceae bacterium]